MFIPVDPTTKTKIAFIPESFHLTYSASYLPPEPVANRENINTNVPYFQIATYWQEVSKGNLITVFGIATIKFIQNSLADPTFDIVFPNRKHEDVSLEELLAATTSRDISKAGVAKLGHSKPYFRPESHYGAFLEENINALDFYDPQSLATLHANPTALPLDAIGWYRVNPKDK